MKAITLHEAKQNLEHVIGRVLADAEPTIIVGEAGEQVVLISLDAYTSWQETLALLANPANAAHLAGAVAQARAGVVAPHDLAE